VLVTDREEVYRRVLVLRDHGRVPGGKLFCSQEVAFKSRMSSLQAAPGLAQLERIDELLARKRQMFEWYRTSLNGVPQLTLNPEPAGTRSAYCMGTALVNPSPGLSKETVMVSLAK